MSFERTRRQTEYVTIRSGVEGSEWEDMYYKYTGLHQAVKSEKSGEKQGGQGTVVISNKRCAMSEAFTCLQAWLRSGW